MMEIKGLKMMSDILLDERIVKFTSDGDIKGKTPLTKKKDPGHVMLSILRSIR